MRATPRHNVRKAVHQASVTGLRFLQTGRSCSAGGIKPITSPGKLPAEACASWIVSPCPRILMRSRDQAIHFPVSSIGTVWRRRMTGFEATRPPRTDRRFFPGERGGLPSSWGSPGVFFGLSIIPDSPRCTRPFACPILHQPSSKRQPDLSASSGLTRVKFRDFAGFIYLSVRDSRKLRKGLGGSDDRPGALFMATWIGDLPGRKVRTP